LKLDIRQEARNNLSEISFYTFVNFGERQMNIYRQLFKANFNRLCQNPETGIVRPGLGSDIYSLISGEHIIFYSFNHDTIIIVKIIHGSRDLLKEFIAINEA